jgi:hypothetical protein
MRVGTCAVAKATAQACAWALALVHRVGFFEHLQTLIFGCCTQIAACCGTAALKHSFTKEWICKGRGTVTLKTSQNETNAALLLWTQWLASSEMLCEALS